VMGEACRHYTSESSHSILSIYSSESQDTCCSKLSLRTPVNHRRTS
jgi:hypothetical protein